MIIDIHTHLKAGEDEAAFIGAMDEFGVDKAVLLPILYTAEHNPDDVNRFVCDAVSRHSNRFIGFATVHPLLREAPSMLERYVREYGLKGVKLHTLIQNFYPSDPGIYPLVRKVIELDIPILFHVGPLRGGQSSLRCADPLEIDDLALAFPEAKIIMSHGDPLGLYPWIVSRHPNVYMDTVSPFSGRATLFPGIVAQTLGILAHVPEEERDNVALKQDLGSRKILYGSDLISRGNARHHVRKHIEPIRALDISEAAKTNILGANAARLLKLEMESK